MRQLIKFFNEYFSFSRKERNGLLILLSILFILIISSYTLPYVIRQESENIKKFEKDIALALAMHTSERPNINYSKPDHNNTSELFKFDPNDLSEKDWLKLGLNNKQIQTIKNFERKGGKFYRKEDLRKIYSITPDDYKRLEPYIVIRTFSSEEKNKHLDTFSSSKSREKKKVIVDINSADSLQLMTLKGIGVAFANRIIRYRNRLGGFYKKEQLKEVYGVDSSLYDKIMENIFVDRNSIQKLNINSVTFDDLKKHPYLNYSLANAIINYRKQHGNFQEINDLKKIAIMEDHIFDKLQSYLTIE